VPLSNATQGTGMLAFPYAFSQVGIVPGMISCACAELVPCRPLARRALARSYLLGLDHLIQARPLAALRVSASISSLSARPRSGHSARAASTRSP
jgi:hypothetical protein